MSLSCFRTGIGYAVLITASALAWIGMTADAGAEVTAAGKSWPDEQACRSEKPEDPVVEAWCIAIDTTSGNCIACHAFNVSPWPPGLPGAGNIAPPMVAMQGRFPERRTLQAVVADATTINPQTSMPPYLRHGILSRRQIELLVDFLLTL